MRLKDWLDKQNLNNNDFAKMAELNPKTLYRILKGEDMYLSTAVRIKYVTKGEVTFCELLGTCSA